MLGQHILYRSDSDEWETPQDLFDKLNDEFHFTLDACASERNAKCRNYYTKEQDALKNSWLGVVFCNPPYGRSIGRWIKKAHDEIQSNSELIVLLIPSRTDTQWFHDYLYQKPNVEIRFVKGRIKFGGCKVNAPFPSLIAIMRKEQE